MKLVSFVTWYEVRRQSVHVDICLPRIGIVEEYFIRICHIIVVAINIRILPVSAQLKSVPDTSYVIFTLPSYPDGNAPPYPDGYDMPSKYRSYCSCAAVISMDLVC